MKTKTVELFDVLLRHGGHIGHEIPRKGITFREITLLRHIHGNDAISDEKIKPAAGAVKKKEIDERLELFEFARAYAKGGDFVGSKKLIEAVFSTPLMGFESWLSETMELEEMQRQEDREKSQRAVAADLATRRAEMAQKHADKAAGEASAVARAA